jgi:periplasmic protein TonB
MTAMSVRAPPYPHLDWPRVGAWSGTLSLHLVILALFLAPSAAILVMRHTEVVVPVVDIIPEARPLPAEPDPPVPVHHQVVAPVTHHETPPVITKPTEYVVLNNREDQSGTESAAPRSGSDTGTDVAPSAITYGPQPQRVAYPRESLIAREQGTVVLRVLVGADGVVEKVEIEKSSGHARLDRAAREAVSKWSFHPAQRSGAAYAAWALVPVTFSLSLL